MNEFANSEQLKQCVIDGMERYAKQLEILELNNEAAKLRSKIIEFRSGIFQVLFTGVFNGGKSTLLNALMSHKLLQTSINPETAVITKIVFGESDKLTIFYKDSRPASKMSIDSFFKTFSVDNSNEFKFNDIDYVILEQPIQNKMVQYVDSPGLNNTGTEDRIANEFSAKADAIVFLINATKALDVNDKRYIQQNFENRQLKNVFFVVNWYNEVSGTDEPKFQQRIYEDLRQVFLDEKGNFDKKLFNERVFCLDAYGSECARTGTPYMKKVGKKEMEMPIEDLETGVPEFEKALNEFLLSSDKDKEAYNGYIPKMAAMYVNADNAVQSNLNNSQKSINALEHEKSEIDKAIKETTRIVNGINDVFTNSVREILLNASENFDSFVTDVEVNWDEYFSNVEIDNFGIKEEAKIIAIKTKDKFQKLIGKESDSLARDEEFRNIVMPISDAIQKYITDKATVMANRIAQSCQAIIQQLVQTLEEYCKNLKDISSETDIDIQSILIMIAEAANVNTEILNGDISIAKLLIGILLGDFDTSFDALTGDENWGAFLKDAITNTLIEYVIYLVVGYLTGTYLIYIIARGIMAYFNIKNKTANIAQKCVLSSKGESITSLRNAKLSFQNNLETKFRKGLNLSQASLTEGVLGELKQKQNQLSELIKQMESCSFNREKYIIKTNTVKKAMIESLNDIAYAVSGRGFSEEAIRRLAVAKQDNKG